MHVPTGLVTTTPASRPHARACRPCDSCTSQPATCASADESKASANERTKAGRGHPPSIPPAAAHAAAGSCACSLKASFPENSRLRLGCPIAFASLPHPQAYLV
eukprot:365350-Chlamydomonas_euryale.AAC.8